MTELELTSGFGSTCRRLAACVSLRYHAQHYHQDKVSRYLTARPYKPNTLELTPIRVNPENETRSPNGAHSLNLSSEATIAELQTEINALTGILNREQDIRVGFPPKPLPASSETTTLAQLSIKSGESLLVAQKSSNDSTARPSESSSSLLATTTTTTTASRSNSGSSTSSSTSAIRPVVTDQVGLSGNVVASATASTNPVPSGSGPSRNGKYVAVDGGFLCLRVVPDDNSCLFTSVALVLAPGRSDLRQIVADGIRADPETWSDVVLGQPQQDYITTILKPNSWGGAIELSILSNYFATEIASIDVQTGRIDRFGQESGFENVALLVYSGIHYDAITFSYSEPSSNDRYPYPNLDFDTKLFSNTYGQFETMLNAAKKLTDDLRKEHAFTDAATFTLKCEKCGKALKGEKQARSHAEETGHVDFGEYDGQVLFEHKKSS